MYELVYGSGFEEDILEKYPNAKIKDASDYIHEHRFEVAIEGVSEKEFYKFAIEKGFLDVCLGFSVMAMGNKNPELMQELVEYAKTLSNSVEGQTQCPSPTP